MPGHETLSKDSISFYTTDSESLIKYNRNGSTIIWKRELKVPAPLTADLGYGEQGLFHPESAIVTIDTDNFILIEWKFLESDIFSMNTIQTYSLDGTFLSEFQLDFAEGKPFIITNPPVRWINGSLIIPYSTYSRQGDENCNYAIIDQTGQEITIEKNIELTSLPNPLYTWEGGYASVIHNMLTICYLEHGTKECNLNDLIKEMYPEESNLPQIKTIKSITQSEEGFTVSTTLLFYNGEQKDIDIQVTNDMLMLQDAY